MIVRWDTLCGRKSVQTETDTVKMFGGAMCCWNCYSVYMTRKSWHESLGFMYP